MNEINLGSLQSLGAREICVSVYTYMHNYDERAYHTVVPFDAIPDVEEEGARICVGGYYSDASAFGSCFIFLNLSRAVIVSFTHIGKAVASNNMGMIVRYR